MTDIGESIQIAATSDLGEDECWFCKEEEKGPKKNNVIEADPQTEMSDDEDYPPENDVGNDSSELGRRLGNRPNWQILRPVDNVPTTIVPGAHHLIPGKASLENAMKDGLKHFMCEKGDYNLRSDIGYNVNSAANGVWLPGNYQMRPGNEDYTDKWGDYGKNFKDEYAKRAMQKSNAQFHDAHTDYNKNVRKTLRKIKEALIPADDKCPLCGRPNHDKTNPPFRLVARLNFVSLQHRKMLAGIGTKKSRKFKMVSNGYHTSSRSFAYFGKDKPKKK